MEDQHTIFTRLIEDGNYVTAIRHPGSGMRGGTLRFAQVAGSCQGNGPVIEYEIKDGQIALDDEGQLKIKSVTPAKDIGGIFEMCSNGWRRDVPKASTPLKEDIDAAGDADGDFDPWTNPRSPNP